MGCSISFPKGASNGGGANNQQGNTQPKKLIIPKRQSGFIKKEGQKYKTWKNRYFVLEIGIISYYTDDIKKNKSAQQKGEPMNVRGYKIMENLENKNYLSLEHRADKEARILNLEFSSAIEKETWKLAFKQHIDYLDALHAEQILQQSKALEKPRCINIMTLWMKTNAPQIITTKAQLYGTMFYDNGCINMELVALKIAEKKTFALELGVERDDNDDIINGLLKPKEGDALLTGPNLLGKYTVLKTSSALTKSEIAQPTVYKANK